MGIDLIDNNEHIRIHEVIHLVDAIENDIADFINSAGIEEKQDFINVLIHIAAKSILVFREVLHLCMLGFPDGALSLYRNLYEQLIHLYFFNAKKDDIKFSEIINNYYIASEIKRYSILEILLDENDPRHKCCQEILNSYKKELNQYSLKNDYRWSGFDSFSKMIKYIENDVIVDKHNHELFEELNTGYRLACISLHSNCLGNSKIVGTNTSSFYIDIAPTWTEIEMPLRLSLLSFIKILEITSQTLNINIDYHLKRLEYYLDYFTNLILEKKNTNT